MYKKEIKIIVKKFKWLSLSLPEFALSVQSHSTGTWPEKKEVDVAVKKTGCCFLPKKTYVNIIVALNLYQKNTESLLPGPELQVWEHGFKESGHFCHCGLHHSVGQCHAPDLKLHSQDRCLHQRWKSPSCQVELYDQIRVLVYWLFFEAQFTFQVIHSSGCFRNLVCHTSFLSAPEQKRKSSWG